MEKYERVSQTAWDFCQGDSCQSWQVIGKKVGTAGNMAKYAYCREYRYPDGTIEIVKEVDLNGC